MTGMAAAHMRYVGRRLRRSWASKSSTGVAWTRSPIAKPPTRFTSARRSSPAVATTLAAESGSVRSACTSSRRSCPRTRSSSPPATPGTTPRQPSSGRVCVPAAPRPPVPPVTIAVRAMCQVRSPGDDSLHMKLQPMPSAPAPTVFPMLVRDFQDGQDLDVVLLIRAVETRRKRDGGAFLRLVLRDRTGRVVAIARAGVPALHDLCRPGRPVRVAGRYECHARWGPQISVGELGEPAPESFDLAELVDGPPRSAPQMEADLRELVATIQHPDLRALLDRILGEHTDSWRRYRSAPAAKHYHQAYVHGLLEHSLSVAQGVHALAARFPGIDHDVAVTGALLHDIGKLEAYTSDPACIDMTDAGRLQGEIPLGYYRIRREIEDIPGFPRVTAQAVLHIILSHHGSLEHGSPVVPCTREATLVHHIDNLGGRLGSFDRLEKGLAPGESWTAYDRGIGSSAYFGAAVAEERRAA